MSQKDIIFALWGLSSNDLTTITTRASPEMLENSIATIQRYLCFLFPQETVRNNWMRKPNGAFDGRRPIDLLLEDGELGLDVIEKYLAGAMQR